MEFGILSKIYDAIKCIPKTSGAMNVGTFKEYAVSLGSTEKDITNCVFGVTGKGKLHAAWLSPYYGFGGANMYKWGLKVVIDDDTVFDVRKDENYSTSYDSVVTIGFMTSALYSSGTEGIYSSTATDGAKAGKIIPFITPNGAFLGGKSCYPSFSILPHIASSYTTSGNYSNLSSNGTFSGTYGGICILPESSAQTYTLSHGANNGRYISVSSVIPDPLVFNKSVKVYASNKIYGSNYSAVRVAYTLEG